jgi:hypothetical protein
MKLKNGYDQLPILRIDNWSLMITHLPLSFYALFFVFGFAVFFFGSCRAATITPICTNMSPVS